MPRDLNDLRLRSFCIRLHPIIESVLKRFVYGHVGKVLDLNARIHPRLSASFFLKAPDETRVHDGVPFIGDGIDAFLKPRPFQGQDVVTVKHHAARADEMNPLRYPIHFDDFDHVWV